MLVSVLVQRSERRITKANPLLPSGVHDPANARLDAASRHRTLEPVERLVAEAGTVLGGWG